MAGRGMTGNYSKNAPRHRKNLFRSTGLALKLIAGAGLCRGQARGENAKRRAGYVLHPHLVAELDRRGVAAVFAADSDFKTGPGLASAFDSDANQFTHAIAIDDREGILLDDAFGEIGWQDFVDVIARETKCGLSEIIGAEAEELGFLGDLVGNQ